MGCTDSKSADTQNQKQTTENSQNNQNPAKDEDKKNEESGSNEQQEDKNKDEEVYVTVEEATTYVSNELGLTEEKASKIVAKVNKCEDGRIANKELILLHEAIKAKRDEIRPKFAAYDTDGSGTVSVDEAYTVLKDIFNGIEEKNVKAMIQRFDENNTGKMNFNEFIFFYASICSKKEKIVQRFNEIDADNSGELSGDEACTVIQEECMLSEFQARSIIDDFDQNKDGKLNKAEFEALFLKLF